MPRNRLQIGMNFQGLDKMQAASDWTAEMHFQKGLAGASAEVIAAVQDTPTNPVVTEAFMLPIVASEGPQAFADLLGHEPNVEAARRDTARIGLAMTELRKVAPESGAYVAESSYFQPNWQRAYWGANYPRLPAAKARYDPGGLFSPAMALAARAGARMGSSA